jgi:hypothetical protein
LLWKKNIGGGCNGFIDFSELNLKRSISVAGSPWFVVEKKSLNPDKPEITNYKHQITNKSQIPIPNDRNIGLKF